MALSSCLSATNRKFETIVGCKTTASVFGRLSKTCSISSPDDDRGLESGFGELRVLGGVGAYWIPEMLQHTVGLGSRVSPSPGLLRPSFLRDCGLSLSQIATAPGTRLAAGQRSSVPNPWGLPITPIEIR
jgi:hypothetical protein